MTEEIFVRRATGLVREVGAFTVLAMGAGFTIADGVHLWAFQVPFYEVGSNYLISAGMAFVFELFSALCIMFLAVAMPRAASDYVAVSRTLHPLLGYLDTWLCWQANVFVVGLLSYLTVTFLGTSLYMTGVMVKSAGLMGIGELLATDLTWGLVIGCLLVILSGVIAFFGMRAYKYVIGILFVVPVIGSALELGSVALCAATGAPLTSLWNSCFGAGAYEEVVRVATQNGWADYTSGGVYGWPGPWKWDATLMAIPAAGYLWWGMAYGNYVAGEVREPSKSYLWGILGAIAVIAVFYFASIGIVYSYYGDFLSMYDYVLLGGFEDQLTIQAVLMPSLSLFSAATVGGSYPWMAALIGLTGALWVFSDVPIAMVVTSRMTFAFSFDRFFPETFAKVSDKWHSPHYAIALVTIFGLLTTYLSVYQPWWAMINAFAGMIWRYVLASWACMLLPLTRPDIYRRGFTWEVSGFPVVALIGILSTIMHTWFFFWVIWSIPLSNIGLLWNTIWWSFALVLFAVYYYYNKARGIDVEALWKTIPPA